MVQMTHVSESDRSPLCGKRILVSGKGGSGKSTLVALMAIALQTKAYEVIVLDGDASNPEGLVRLLFGLGVEGEPKPLIEFFGGVDVVTCPVDDPSPLTRIGDSEPVHEHRIDLFNEIPDEYYLQKNHTTLLQTGKIETYGQGCDGPLEKIVRDFMVLGDVVTLIDMKAGIEHFGRKIPDRLDIIIGVLDYTLESVSIAKRMAAFCQEAEINDFWLILNKTESREMESLIMERLGNLCDRVIGSIAYDQEMIVSALSGKPVGECKSLKDVGRIMERLEQVIATRTGKL